MFSFIVAAFVMIFAIPGCTLFSKTTSDDEMEKIAKDVLEKKQGIEIQVKPIPVNK